MKCCKRIHQNNIPQCPNSGSLVRDSSELASILFLITSRWFFSQKENNLDLGQMNILTSFPRSILSSEFVYTRINPYLDAMDRIHSIMISKLAFDWAFFII